MSVTLIIIVVTSLISIYAFSDANFFEKWKHNPYIEDKNRQYYRLLTSGFLHGGWPHLIINMIVLYSFGSYVESKFTEIFGPGQGELLLLLLYVSAIIVADLPTLRKYKDAPGFSSVGASGAVSALLFACILFNPWASFELYFAIPIRAIVFGVLYLVYSQWASRNQHDNTDHEAHFYGAVYGVLFTVALGSNIFTDFVNMLVHESPWW